MMQSKRKTIIIISSALFLSLLLIRLTATSFKIQGSLIAHGDTAEESALPTMDRDENGVISFSEYRQILHKTKRGIEQGDIQYDINGDKQLSQDDIIALARLIRDIRTDECPRDSSKKEKGVCGCFVPEIDVNNNGRMDCLDDTGRTEELLAPSGLFVSVKSLSETNAIIQLTWNDNSWNEESFDIERSVNNGGFAFLKNVPMNSTETINGNLTPGNLYAYRVRARKGGQVSENSREMQIRASEFYLDRAMICQKYANRETVPLPAHYKVYEFAGVNLQQVNNYNYLRNSRAFVIGANAGSEDRPTFLIFPEGKYFVDEYLFKSVNTNGTSKIANIQWVGLQYTRLLGCGTVKFETSGRYRRTYSETLDQSKSEDGVQLFRFINADHVSIEGIELDGNSQDATHEEKNHDGNASGLSFVGSTNYTVKDMNIHHFGADGIYIGGGGIPPNYPDPEPVNPVDRPARIADKNVRIHTVRMANNGRQGMTIVQARNVWISNSQFLDTGRSGSPHYGPLDPSAGIDIEPNYFDLARDINNHKETGTYDDKRIDVLTGDILIENSKLIGNKGAQITAGLGRTINPYIRADNTCCTENCSALCPTPWNATNNNFTIWPHARVQNVTIRHTEIVSSVDSIPLVVNLAAQNGLLEHSLVDSRATPNGKTWLTYHGGSSFGPNKNDELMQSAVRRSTILSAGEALYAHWARHPIDISQNIIQGAITILTPEIIPENPGSKKIIKNALYLPYSFVSNATALGVAAMRTWGNEFEDNRYCLAKNSSTLLCEETLPSIEGHLFISYGAPRTVKNDLYRSGCLLRPQVAFQQCTDQPYIFP